MNNPALAEVTRGGIVESFHTGALIVVDASGVTRFSLGNVERDVFPRSAYKPLQSLALLESGAASAHALSASDIALSCASHNGEAIHHDRVVAWLDELGLSVDALACGVDTPMDTQCKADFHRAQGTPDRAFHNCSGKHAGMLTLCQHAGHSVENYQHYDHPSQQHWMAIMGEMCGLDASRCTWDYDGCGLPALAMPLRALATGFAKLSTPASLVGARADAATAIHSACTTHPMMVAGSRRACTRVMETLGDAVLVKTGAEGVFAGSVPSRGVGFAIKIDDGSHRGSEAALGAVLDALGLLDDNTRSTLASTLTPAVVNSRGQHVGEVRVPTGLVSQLQNQGAGA